MKAEQADKKKKLPPLKKKSITRKIFTRISLILLISLILPVIAYDQLPEPFYYLLPGVRMWLASDEIMSTYGDEDNFTTAIKAVETGYDAKVEIYNSDGALIYSTNYTPDMTYNLPFPLSQAPVIDEKYKTNYDPLNDESMVVGQRGFSIGRYATAGIEVDFLIHYQYTETGERMNIIMQTSALSSNTRIVILIMSAITILLLLLSLVIIGLALMRLTKPIKQMVQITDKMSKLDFGEKLPPTKVLELSELSDKINTMSDTLDSALTDLQEKNDKLQQDIENERTLDNLRQVFISGVSHELKTPIAIIQGYAEGAMTFIDDNPQAAKEYCTVIMDESVRMNQMVMKLLEITKYDSGAYVPTNEIFSIRDMIAQWFAKESNSLTEQGITAVNDISADIYGEGDSIILASVANNYLSNAVSHVDGEKIIRTYTENLPEVYRVWVENTGNPIADKDIDKIWNSFYRADKAMSRSQGRFGLGLAIVASIQKLHGQGYGVENTQNGVRFYFDIRKAEKQNNKGL